MCDQKSDQFDARAYALMTQAAVVLHFAPERFISVSLSNPKKLGVLRYEGDDKKPRTAGEVKLHLALILATAYAHPPSDQKMRKAKDFLQEVRAGDGCPRAFRNPDSTGAIDEVLTEIEEVIKLRREFISDGAFDLTTTIPDFTVGKEQMLEWWR